MNTIQVTNITIDELVEHFSNINAKLIADIKPSKQYSGPGIINVLNKRNAARTLNISESTFDKFYARGCIPCTVNAGMAKNGQPVRRWAEHHLRCIKPVIQHFLYAQSDANFTRAIKEIKQILGL
jgi:hypothetical protein